MEMGKTHTEMILRNSLMRNKNLQLISSWFAVEKYILVDFKKRRNLINLLSFVKGLIS